MPMMEEGKHENRSCRPNKTSKYKGVAKDSSNRWKARIRFNNELIYLGMFADEHDAAVAYNSAAIKYFGEFACLNEVAR